MRGYLQSYIDLIKSWYYCKNSLIIAQTPTIFNFQIYFNIAIFIVPLSKIIFFIQRSYYIQA